MLRKYGIPYLSVSYLQLRHHQHTNKGVELLERVFVLLPKAESINDPFSKAVAQQVA